MDWKNKWKGKKESWLILLLIGLLLVVISIPTSKEKEIVEAPSKLEGDYVSQMETKLESVLKNVQGVGKVSVMITISESSEKVIEKDEETSIQSSLEADGSTNSSTQQGETSVYAGNETPYIKKEISPQVEGVLVVAEGGDNAVVIEQITSAVQALFGIAPHKIKVMKHN